MDIIDDEGRLFGAVNVIDALVVLLVLAVVVAGIAVVNPFGGETERATRYATLDLGDQPQYIAERVTAGDEMNIMDAPGRMVVTDTYVGGAPNGNTTVFARVRIQGTLVERGENQSKRFLFAGAPVRSGTELELQTDEYEVTGSITQASTSGDRLQTNQTPVIVERVVPAATADAIETGDTYRLANRTVGTIESVEIGPTGDPGTRRVTLGLTLQTIRVGGGTEFGDRRVQVGQRIPFITSDYGLEGNVMQVGTTEPPGEQTTTTVVVKATNLQPEIAENVRVGMTENGGDSVSARVTDKRVEPAVVILTSESGDIYQREHPRNKDVYLTLELQTRTTPTGIQFHGGRLQVGTNVVFDFGSITVNGQVVELRTG